MTEHVVDFGVVPLSCFVREFPSHYASSKLTLALTTMNGKLMIWVREDMVGQQFAYKKKCLPAPTLELFLKQMFKHCNVDLEHEFVENIEEYRLLPKLSLVCKNNDIGLYTQGFGFTHRAKNSLGFAKRSKINAFTLVCKIAQLSPQLLAHELLCDFRLFLILGQ